jgi:hypothetical protein
MAHRNIDLDEKRLAEPMAFNESQNQERGDSPRIPRAYPASSLTSRQGALG